ncbi:hypothetical protein BTA51_28780, partial [Hahella sp. CCB-MM4]
LDEILKPENVTWSSMSSGLQSTTSGIVKTGAFAWDASARSDQTIQGEGVIEFSLPQVNKSVMVGLNQSNTTDSYTDIDYAFFSWDSERIRLYEEGNLVKDLSIPQKAGNRYRIAMEDGGVRYYVRPEGESEFILVHTSAKQPDLSAQYFVDTSFKSSGAEVIDVTVSEKATPTSVRQYQVYDARGQIKYSIDAEGYVTEHTYDALGRVTTTSTYEQPLNLDTVREITVASLDRVLKSEEVTWASMSSGLESTSSGIVKTGASAWDASARTDQTIQGEGVIEFSLPQVNQSVMVGLNSNHTTDSYTDIDYAFFSWDSERIRLYEEGNLVKDLSIPQKAGNRYRIAMEDGVVRYYVRPEGESEFILVHTSTKQPDLSAKYFVDTSFKSTGAEVVDVTVKDKTASKSIRQYQVYDARGQVKYSLDAEGYVTEYEYDAQGRNIAGHRYSDPLENVPASLTLDALKAALPLKAVQVNWTDLSDDVVVRGTAIELNNPEDLSVWDDSARSVETMPAEGFIEFEYGDEAPTMIGLNSLQEGDNYKDIDYAFYLYYNNEIHIWEEGEHKGKIAIPHQTGNRYRIALKDGQAHYYIKEAGKDTFTLVQTSTRAVDSNADYFVDAALYRNNNEVPGVILSRERLEEASAEVSVTETQRTIYDNRGQARFSIDSLGYVTETTYDARGQAVRATRYDAVYTGQEFTLSALEAFASAQTSPVEGHKIYDARGQLAYDVDPEGYVTGYTYNAAGQMIETRQYSEALPESGVTYTQAGIEAWLPQLVSWEYQSSGNVQGFDGQGVRISGEYGWNEALRSSNSLTGEGFLEFSIPTDGKRVMVGLSKSNNTDSYTDLNYAIYRRWDNHIFIYEGGVSRADLGVMAQETRFRIEMDGTVVKYYVEASPGAGFALLHTSATAANVTAPYVVDTSFLEEGATIRDVVMGQSLSTIGGTVQVSRVVYDDRGQARFSINALGQVTENRYDHAGRVTETLRYAGTYSGTAFTEDALSSFAASQTAGTQSTHQIYDDRGQLHYAVDAGGYVTAYTYNAQGQAIGTYQYSGALPDTGVEYSEAGIEAWLPQLVTWEYQTNGMEGYLGTSERTQATGSWDRSARSRETLRGDGYLEFSLPGDGKRIMAGLNKTNSSDGYSDLDFAIHKSWENHFRVFEDGVLKIDFGKYDTETRFRIVAEGNQVKYYLKSPTDSAFVLKYTSTKTYDSAAEYFVDSSL